MIVPEILTQFDYFIKWRITYNCNYKCEYCMQSRNHCQENRGEQPYDKIKVARKIADILRPNTQIELIGGEISIVKEIPFITWLFRNKGAYVKATTNLSRPWEFYRGFNWVRASYHPSQCDTEEFKEKLIKLRDAGVEISTEVVLSDVSSEENNRKKEEYWKWCNENGIKITVDNDRYNNGGRTKTLNQNVHNNYVYIDGVKTPRQDIFVKEKGVVRTPGMLCYRGVTSMYVILDKVSICPFNPNKDIKWYDTPNKCQFYCGELKCMSQTIDQNGVELRTDAEGMN